MGFFEGIKRCQCLNLLLTGLVVMLVGGWFAVTGLMDWFGTSKKMPDMMTMTEASFESGKYIEGDATACFGAFYEIYESNGPGWLSKRKSNQQRIYLVPVGKDKDMLIGVMVNQSKFYELNSIMGVTLQGAEVPINQALHCYGEVKSYDARMQRALDKYMDGTGIKAKALPYYIDFSEARTSHISAYVGFGVMFIGLMIILIGFIPQYRKEIVGIRLGVNQSVGRIIYEAPTMDHDKEKKMSVFGDDDFDVFMRGEDEIDGSNQ